MECNCHSQLSFCSKYFCYTYLKYKRPLLKQYSYNVRANIFKGRAGYIQTHTPPPRVEGYEMSGLFEDFFLYHWRYEPQFKNHHSCETLLMITLDFMSVFFKGIIKVDHCFAFKTLIQHNLRSFNPGSHSLRRSTEKITFEQ